LLRAALAEACLEDEVLSFDVAPRTHTLAERRQIGLRPHIRSLGTREPDTRDLRGLPCRPRRERASHYDRESGRSNTAHELAPTDSGFVASGWTR
jgi:hypothetical protein